MKQFEDDIEACTAMLKAGDARPGALTNAERSEVGGLRARLVALNDAVAAAVDALGAARARRQSALAALRARLLAAKAHVSCLAAMNGITLNVLNLGKTAWTVGRVAPLAHAYRQVLDASGHDPLTRTVRDGLAAATEAFVRADEEVRSREVGLGILRSEAHREARRTAGRAAELRAMMALRLPRDERRAVAAALAGPPTETRAA